MSAPITWLESLTNTTSSGQLLTAAKSGDCASSSCGSSSRPTDMDSATWEKVKDHPCFSEEAHHYFARMHVAVAPACNIQCNYCNRKYDCANESRPGVVSEKLTPDQALRKVIAVANEVPQLSVLGIAGPGDACYDWKKTRATFERVASEIPDIKLCISTNGLALPEHVDELAEMNISHVTITINMVDPAVGEKIYPWIFYGHRRYTGIAAAKILHEQQMLGLEMLSERGILTKINSVMIPGVNDQHLIEVNKWVKERGAFLHNVMPLISEPAHGTWFGLAGQRGPNALELKAFQDRLEGGAKLMRHCRQCRADAVGLLGADRGQEFTLDQIPLELDYDGGKRHAYREVVARIRDDHSAAKKEAIATVASVNIPGSLQVAVATKGGGRINEHFGHAKEFQVYEASQTGIKFVGHRKVEPYCHGGWGEDATLGDIIAALEGIDFVLCARIGDCPKKQLLEAGIQATDAFGYDYIEAAISALYATKHGSDRSQLTA
ncbi:MULTISPECIES: nitrogenase cofactor biosynthesis protein NifB [Sinorhizobium/Ensifer group]|uniref:FeMo cofactor biosynthesis protein NifB n=1 Tax=Sinorhizobium sojae CCBAU 05684 TaxID=716928 RepID=A0A249PNI1_9HYPH|nr:MULTISPECIES: nitrogenase cofactor biosynthesis protein NifB [Sinorhizobium]MCK3781138.1 nitrogenase cofactor biosynthesis protein NifB [Ensifer sesbaniae]ASY67272.1 Nitrogenase FeMo-cofactor synthesis FeS core scaffold and assembly protein NifB [Sinorhizobium sojae CCBAU 05684]AWM29900.1 Nitrogenase FeMo-cofactor synthesis FeS core scaffold and assembly protein NifB [Sinorhizobium fredii CCBAU 25509]MQW99492.1 nitrogenase cofactor biosynthesis protein NifB [Sinorhizobium fredii]UTY47890.1 